MKKLLNWNDWCLEENLGPRHPIKSESYWRKVLDGNQYALSVLDTVMRRQGGLATDRQMEVMRRAERGERSPYSTKS